MKKKKKFKETKIGKFLAQHGSKILNTAGDLIPGGAVLKVVAGMIDNDPELSEADKATAKEMIALEIANEQEITKRWQADVNSDSWLSKNVRPIIALYSWVLLTVVSIFMITDYDVPDNVFVAIAGLAATITGAYFGLREYGKKQGLKYDNN